MAIREVHVYPQVPCFCHMVITLAWTVPTEAIPVFIDLSPNFQFLIFVSGYYLFYYSVFFLSPIYMKLESKYILFIID